MDNLLRNTHMLTSFSHRSIAGFLLFLAAAGCAARPEGGAQDFAAELRRLDEAWYQAAIAKDADAFTSYMDDGFIAATGNGGLIDKAGWVDAVRTSTVVYRSGEHRDVRVQRYGDVAVVSGRYVVATIRSGQPDSARGSFVATWLKRDNRWLVITAGYNREVAR